MTNEPKFGYVILYVANVLQTVEFYEKAFGLQRLFVHESEQYAQMRTGDTSLAFADEKTCPTASLFAPNRLQDRAAGAELAFTVSNVEDAYARALNAGSTAVQSPATKPWGQVVSYVRDCNGFLVEICSPMGESR